METFSDELISLLADYVHNVGQNLSERAREIIMHITPEDICKTVETIRSEVQGFTALHVALVRDHPEVIELLINSVTHADRRLLLRHVNILGRTTVHCAARKGDTRTMEFLLNSMKPEDRIQVLITQSVSGNTAAHCASRKCHTDTLQCMLHYLTDEERFQLMKIRNGGGNTAMHCAAGSNHTSVFQLVVSALSQERSLTLFSICNKDGQNALDVALEHKSNEAAEFIRQRRGLMAARPKQTPRRGNAASKLFLL